MIRSFRGLLPALILQRRRVPKGFPTNVAKVARRKLVQLNNATMLGDLAVPPGNRLEALRGDLAGKHSIPVADRIPVVRSRTGGRGDRGLSLKGGAAMVKKLPPVHPGEILREEFLRPMNLTPYAVARALGVPRTRIERLTREQTALTADTALRLARYFRTSPAFWMGIQSQYELERAEDELGPKLREITPTREAKPAA
jgi:addiction module HigA family antidote